MLTPIIFNNCDPKTIKHVRFLDWYNRNKQSKGCKKKIIIVAYSLQHDIQQECEIGTCDIRNKKNQNQPCLMKSSIKDWKQLSID